MSITPIVPPEEEPHPCRIYLTELDSEVSVCTELSLDDTLAYVKNEIPHNWIKAPHSYEDGKSNPSPCHICPEKTHYLLTHNDPKPNRRRRSRASARATEVLPAP